MNYSQMEMKWARRGRWKPVLRIVGPYAALATLWILVSDTVLALSTGVGWNVILSSVLKGMTFIAVTSALLACLVRRTMDRAQMKFQKERRLRREIAHSRALLKCMFDSLPDVVLARFDHDAQSIYNTSAEGFLSGPAPSGIESFEALSRHVRDSGTERARICVFPSKDPLDFDFKRHDILGQAGRKIGELIIGHSVREERRAHRAKTDTESRYRVLFQRNPHPMWVFRLSDQRFVAVNLAACTHYGYTEREFLARSLFDIRPPKEKDRLAEHFLNYPSSVPGEIRQAGVWTHIHRSGRIMEVEITSSEIDFDGDIARLVLAREVTQERRAALKLVRYQSRLSELARQLLNKERDAAQRLSRTLHDGVGHDLVRALMLLDAQATVMGGTGRAPTQQLIHDVQTLLRSSLSAVRDMLSELRSSVLDERGLPAALEELTQRWAPQSNLVDVLLELEGDRLQQRLPSEVEFAFYMVAREALANAVQHAKPSLVRLCLTAVADMVTVAVIDDGVGMDVEVVGARSGHVGLQSMIESAEGVGAKLNMKSSLGEGTSVTIRWTRPSHG